MATRNIVPRGNNEGSIGTILKRWLSGFFNWLDISQYIDFDGIENPTYKEGRVFYDENEHTLSLYNDSSEVSHNLGQEVLLRVHNNTGSEMGNGKGVYITGSDGTRCPTVALSKADIEATSHFAGLTTCVIPDGEYGYVNLLGKVHDIDTSAFSDGDTLYLSDTVAGGLTNVKPSIAVIIGYCVVSASGSDGIIYVCGNELGTVGADMLKVNYDTNDDGKVNASDDTDRIKGKLIETPESGDDGKILVYDQTTDSFVLEKKGIYYSDYAEDETESDTTDDINWQQKLRLTFTPEKTGNYIIQWTAEITNSSANKGVEVRLEQDDTTELNYSVVSTTVANGYITTGGFKRINIADLNPHTFDIDFKVESSGTAKIRRVRIHIAKAL